jgi:hypothetical protein
MKRFAVLESNVAANDESTYRTPLMSPIVSANDKVGRNLLSIIVPLAAEKRRFGYSNEHTRNSNRERERTQVIQTDLGDVKYLRYMGAKSDAYNSIEGAHFCYMPYIIDASSSGGYQGNGFTPMADQARVRGKIFS